MARKPGRFELAHRGTLFLDEIGELSIGLQAKILRALEEKKFDRVGGTQPLQVDVRVVAATNRNLKAAVAARQFREDLYFRLSVFPIEIPPLRDRPGDIDMLAAHFIDKFCRDLNKPNRRLSLEAVETLRQYPWPGNVRELQNCIERAVILAEDDIIRPRHLNLAFPTAHAVEERDPFEGFDLSGSLMEATSRVAAGVERRKIAEALRDSGNLKPQAADLLQISYKALMQKIKELGISDA